MPTTLEDDDQGDTIVVKGEFESHLSSPDSLSPEIEPLVTSILSQLNRHPLESPEPSHDTVGVADRSNIQLDRSNRRRTKANVTSMEDRLTAMPELRPLPWRAGVEEGADVETGGESRRKQIRFGCLLASRGEVQDPGCNSCTNGRGKFSLCIALDGFFKGACASCQLSGRPNRCSIKKEDDPASSPAVGTPNAEHSLNQRQPATPSSDSRPSGPPRKRRRTSEVKRANEAKRASLKDVPSWPPQPHHPNPQVTQYQPVQWGQSPPAPPPHPEKVDEAPHKTWAAVNQPPPKPHLPSSGTNGHRPQEHYRPNSTAWATVNQPQPQARPPPLPQTYPPPQTAPPVQRPMQNGDDGHGNGFYSHPERERRESTIGIEDGSTIIDSLPKNKQRQVYGLVSGLQGGIEHLQRELDSLKKALGIDDKN